MTIYLRQHYEEQSAVGRANEFRLLGLLVSVAVFAVISTIVVDAASVYRTVASGVEQALANASDSESGRSP